MEIRVETPAEAAAYKRHMNTMIHESLGAGQRTEPVAFFCECGSESCFETVWLPLVDYEIGRRESGWSVLVPGHGSATSAADAPAEAPPR